MLGVVWVVCELWISVNVEWLQGARLSPRMGSMFARLKSFFGFEIGATGLYREYRKAWPWGWRVWHYLFGWRMGGLHDPEKPLYCWFALQQEKFGIRSVGVFEYVWTRIVRRKGCFYKPYQPYYLHVHKMSHGKQSPKF